MQSSVALMVTRKWLTILATAGIILVCNVFSSPVPPHIWFRDQRKANMAAALSFVSQTAPRGSFIFADHPAGLLLSYYLCHARVVPLQPLAQPFLKSDCGDYVIVTPAQQSWGFQGDTIAAQINAIQRTYSLPPQTPLVLFQAGWFNDADPRWLSALASAGCSAPHHFGRNILVCKVGTQNARPSETTSSVSDYSRR